MSGRWSETVQAHRRDVREAVLDAAWTLVRQDGLLHLTMSRIAEHAGVGRATLYKYFPDVESILRAHHERHVGEHITHLRRLRTIPGAPIDRLDSVLSAYAHICHHRAQHGTPELSALLHKDEAVAGAERAVHELFTDLIAECAVDGVVRTDASSDVLAAYCLNALGAAGALPLEAVRTLVDITVAALHPARAD